MAKTVKINMYKFVDVEKQSASSGVGGQAEAENKLVSTTVSNKLIGPFSLNHTSSE